MASVTEGSNSQVDWIDGDHLYECVPTLSDLGDRYLQAGYGAYHWMQPLRFAQDYEYDRELMLEDLGDDVHPVRHMAYTEESIVRPFLRVQNQIGGERFGPFDISAIRLAALVHDIGECTDPRIKEKVGHVVGDVWYEAKTKENDGEEALVRQFLYDELYGDVPSELLVAAEDIIANREGSPSRELFHSVERLGYYITAMNAGRAAIRLIEQDIGNKNTLRVRQLARLALRVIHNQRAFNQGSAERFPYVQLVLEETHSTYEAIQEQLAFMKGQEVPVNPS